MTTSVCLVRGEGHEKAANKVEEELKRAGLTIASEGCDVAVVVGRDRDVLRFLQEGGPRTPPVLGVDVLGGSSFLAEIPISDVHGVSERLASGDYKVEKVLRIRAIADNREVLGLNEVAVFTNKSAILLEYELWVDGRLVWRDYADGVMVATPTGSTAYALSAGGPVLHRRLSALVVVPVNSMDMSRRPLVIPSNSKVSVERLSRPCEAIVDGISRVRIRRSLKVSKGSPAPFIRLDRSQDLALEKRLSISRELGKMPPSAKLVYKLLEYEGPMSLEELRRKGLLPDRTVRSALGLLLEAGLIRSKTSLRDARRRIFMLSSE